MLVQVLLWGAAWGLLGVLVGMQLGVVQVLFEVLVGAFLQDGRSG